MTIFEAASALPGFPAVPAAGMERKVVAGLVTHLEPAAFWLQRDPDKAQDMADILASGSLTALARSPSSLTVGSPVAAYWSEAWYRGTVTHLEQLDLSVFFIDYGNTDIVPRNYVRAVLEKELVEPPLAVRCELRGLQMSSWSKSLEAADYWVELYCQRLVGSTAIMCSALDPITEEQLPDSLSLLPLGPLAGEVVAVTGDIATFSPACLLPSLQPLEEQLDSVALDSLVPLPSLQQGQLCLSIFSEDSRLYRARVTEVREDGGATVSFIDYGNREDKASGEVLFEVPEWLSSPGPGTVEVTVEGGEVREGPVTLWLEESEGGRVTRTRGRVSLACVETVGRVWLSALSSGERVEKVQELLAATQDLSALESPGQGRTAVTTFSEDGQLYRCRLELCGQDGAVTVRFIDFGNSEVKRTVELFQTPEELGEIPDGAFPVTLDTGLEDTEENQDEVARRLDIEDLYVELSPDSKGQFYDGDQRIVFELLHINCGIDEISEAKKSNVDNSKVIPVERPPSHELVTPISPAGDHSSLRLVSVTHVESSAWVWVTPCTSLQAVDDLQEELQHLKGQLQPLQGAVPGSRAAAEFSEDHQLYRAEVLRAHGDDKVKVVFIDFGNNEVVKTGSLLKLPEELEKMQELAARVRVAGAREGGQGVELEEKLMSGDVAMIQDQDGEATFFVDGVKLDVTSLPQQSSEDASEEVEILGRPAAVMAEEVTEPREEESKPVVEFINPLEPVSKEPMKLEVEAMPGKTEMSNQLLQSVVPAGRSSASPQPHAVSALPVQGTCSSPTLDRNVIDQIKTKMETEMKEQKGTNISEPRSKKPVFQPTATLTAAMMEAWVQDCLAMLATRRREKELGGPLTSTPRRPPSLQDLEDRDHLFALLGDPAGVAVACRLLKDATSATLTAISTALLDSLSEICTSETSAVFVQRLFEQHGASTHLSLLLHVLFSEPLLSTVAFSEAGHGVLEAALLRCPEARQLDLITGVWLGSNLAAVLESRAAVQLGRTLLQVLLQRCGGEEGAHRWQVLARWIDSLTSGPSPLLVSGSLSPAGHLFLLELVVQGELPGVERLVAGIRGNKDLLAKDVMGCLVLRKLEGWM